MDKSAAAAYDRIDKKITENLEAAREILQRMKCEEQENMTRISSSRSTRSNGSTNTKRTVSITEYSVEPSRTDKKPEEHIAKSSMKPKRRPVPPAMIRPPVDSGNSCISSDYTRGIASKRGSFVKNELMFPDAQFVYKTTIATKDSEPLDNLNDLITSESRCISPDILFPNAQAFSERRPSKPNLETRTPKSKKSKSNIPTPCMDRSPMPFKQPSCRKNSTSSEASSISLTQLPMTFYSKNGKMKMMLTKTEDGVPHATGILIPSASKEKSSHKSTSSVTGFPVVPRQLASESRIRTHRNKFKAVFNIGSNTLDISGLFSGKSLKYDHVDKLLINGKSYTC